ncbi:MAG: transposase [Anaerolineales bacterium]
MDWTKAGASANPHKVVWARKTKHYREKLQQPIAALLDEIEQVTEQGIALRKKRFSEPETVFGDVKFNRGFRRFSLRGLQKVETERGFSPWLTICENWHPNDCQFL